MHETHLLKQLSQRLKPEAMYWISLCCLGSYSCGRTAYAMQSVRAFSRVRRGKCEKAYVCILS